MAQHGRSIASKEARSCERQKLRGAYQSFCSFVQQTWYFADITLAGSSAPDMIATGHLCGTREIRRERSECWYRIVS